VARFSRGKRHKDLVSAAAALIARGHDVSVHLIGDGAMREELEDQVERLALGEQVQFLGMRDDVPQCLRELDIFVLPSRFEGLPLTVIEAMATGLPVVATNVGSMAELVEEGVNGFLVEPENPPVLANAIARLVSDERLRRQMGQQGRKMAVAQFDLQAAARQHEELYLRLLARKGTHPCGGG
jgi:glycosyltransferase involved in cell wall biosynthesis